jgi:hypothetical protein
VWCVRFSFSLVATMTVWACLLPITVVLLSFLFADVSCFHVSACIARHQSMDKCDPLVVCGPWFIVFFSCVSCVLRRWQSVVRRPITRAVPRAPPRRVFQYLRVISYGQHKHHPKSMHAMTFLMVGAPAA